MTYCYLSTFTVIVLWEWLSDKNLWFSVFFKQGISNFRFCLFALDRLRYYLPFYYLPFTILNDVVFKLTTSVGLWLICQPLLTSCFTFQLVCTASRSSCMHATRAGAPTNWVSKTDQTARKTDMVVSLSSTSRYVLCVRAPLHINEHTSSWQGRLAT